MDYLDLEAKYDRHAEEHDLELDDVASVRSASPMGGGRGSPVGADAGSGGSDQEDDAEVPGCVPKPREYRFNACHVLLTYSQADGLSIDAIRRFLRDTIHAERWSIGKERHLDGHTHWHVYAYRRSRFNSNGNVRYFDIEGYHANIQGCKKKGGPEGALWYTQKDGNFETQGIRYFPTPNNFVRRAQDLERWQAHNRFQGLSEVNWQSTLPDGTVLGQPDPARKRRHWLIIGPPDAGKSHWLDRQFAGQRIYLVPTQSESRAPAPWDDYQGQKLIVWDDVVPAPGKGTLCLLSDTSRMDRYLAARHSNKVLPGGSCRTLIMICNPAAIPSYIGEDWFNARFNVLYLMGKIACACGQC